jgi:integrase/recombinase XerD
VRATVAHAGEKTSWRFLEFFAANIRNKNTRLAYLRAILPFLAWCEARGLQDLREMKPIVVAVAIEQHSGSPPTVKQHLAAICMLFDWLVMGQVIPMNPASAVRGPKYIVKRGKTPILNVEQTRQLLESIDMSKIAGLRDRVLIGVLEEALSPSSMSPKLIEKLQSKNILLKRRSTQELPTMACGRSQRTVGP